MLSVHGTTKIVRASMLGLLLVAVTGPAGCVAQKEEDVECINQAAVTAQLTKICNNDEPLCGVDCQKAHLDYIDILETECDAKERAVPYRQVVVQCNVDLRECGDDFDDAGFFCSDCGLEYVEVMKGRFKLDGVTAEEAFASDPTLGDALADVEANCSENADKVRAEVSAGDTDSGEGGDGDEDGDDDGDGDADAASAAAIAAPAVSPWMLLSMTVASTALAYFL